MLSAADLLATLEVHPSVDSQTVRRGRAYASSGRVHQLRSERTPDLLAVTALVLGTSLYQTVIEVVRSDRGADLSTACSCPMGFGCKHVIAVATVFAEQERTDGRRDWRQVLDRVLEDSATADAHQERATPVRVAVQLVAPAHRPTGPNTGGPRRRPRLAIRTVRSGSTKRWVKSGVGWNELATLAQGPATGGFRVDARALELLNELKIALVARRGYLMSGNEAIDLHDAGPAVWGCLTRIADAGIELVSTDAHLSVRLSRESAVVTADLQGTGSDVLVRPGLRLAGQFHAAQDVVLIGQPVAHGAVLWRGDLREPGSSVILTPLAEPLTPAARSWLIDGSGLSVDAAALPEFRAEYLPRLAQAVELVSGDGSVRLPEAPVIILRGDLTWHDDGRADLALRWNYTREDGAQQFPVDDPAGRGWRDRPAELAILDRIPWGDELTDMLGVGVRGRGTLTASLQLRDVEAMDFARDLLPILMAQPDVAMVTNGEPPEFREVTGPPRVRFSGRGTAERHNHTDWLELDVIVSFDDDRLGVVDLDLGSVLAALASGQTKIMVHRGTYVDVDRPELDRLARLVRDARQLADQPRTGLRLTRQAHTLLAEVAEYGPSDGELASWLSASRVLRSLAESGEPLPTVPLPTGLSAELRPYQHEGYQWLSFLRTRGLGGILADDMGLGKTVQLLAMIMKAREETVAEPDRTPFLVVAPSSVVSTWVGEAAHFTPSLRVVAITESQARRGFSLDDPSVLGADVVVTTYTLFRLEVEQYTATSWAGMILDEAQQVKNHRSKTHAALRKLSARCRFAVTGTPIENNLMELWAILSLAAPGVFPYADSFRTEIADPVQQGADPAILAHLRRRIRPVMLRRTKDLVAADLPPRQEQTVRVDLSPRHRKIYDTHLQRERQRVLRLLDDLDENRITVLASLTRLRQMSLDPALVDEQYADVGSAKIDELIDRLVELAAEGHRALVFSQFSRFLNRVRDRLHQSGIQTVYLDGRTRNRATVIEEFRRGSAPAFLISLKAGGVGLTLTEADYCFLLDPWWNPAVEAQAVDRAHRIGQTRPVMVYRLISAGTIEQKVIELAGRKADLYRSVLDADGQLSEGLTAADIATLLET